MTRKGQKKLPGKAKKPRTPAQIAAQFKKGQVGNPLGGLAHDPFKRQVKALTSKALAEITSMVMEMSVEEVEEILKSKKLTIAQKTILRAALDASEDGAIDKFNTIVSRAVGVIPQVVHVESPDGSMSPSKSEPKKTAEELKELINKKLDELDAVKNATK